MGSKIGREMDSIPSRRVKSLVNCKIEGFYKLFLQMKLIELQNHCGMIKNVTFKANHNLINCPIALTPKQYSTTCIHFVPPLCQCHPEIVEQPRYMNNSVLYEWTGHSDLAERPWSNSCSFVNEPGKVIENSINNDKGTKQILFSLTMCCRNNRQDVQGEGTGVTRVISILNKMAARPKLRPGWQESKKHTSTHHRKCITKVRVLYQSLSVYLSSGKWHSAHCLWCTKTNSQNPLH